MRRCIRFTKDRIRRAEEFPRAHCMQQRFVQTKLRNDKRGGSQSKYFFYEDPCQNKKCACDATFVSSKISGILEIIAIGFIPALCTEIPRAEIILQRFISATPVRAHKAAHKASHVNEDMQQINISHGIKKAEQVSKYAMQNVALRGQVSL